MPVIIDPTWKWFVEKLLVEILLHVVHHDHGLAGRVELRSTCTAHHLQHVGDGKINVAMRFTIVVLRS